MIVRTGLSTFPLWLSGAPARGFHIQRSCSTLLESPLPWGKGSLRSMGQAQLEFQTRLLYTFLGPGNSFPKHLSSFQGYVGIFPEPTSQGQTLWLVHSPEAWWCPRHSCFGPGQSPWRSFTVWMEPGMKGADRQQPALFPSPHASLEFPGLKDSKCESGPPDPMERCWFRQ